MAAGIVRVAQQLVNDVNRFVEWRTTCALIKTSPNLPGINACHIFFQDHPSVNVLHICPSILCFHDYLLIACDNAMRVVACLCLIVSCCLCIFASIFFPLIIVPGDEDAREDVLTHVRRRMNADCRLHGTRTCEARAHGQTFVRSFNKAGLLMCLNKYM